MKKSLLQILWILLIGFISTLQLTAQSPLAGSYTVGSQVTDDYASISECIDSLELLGISAAVTVNIDTGVFAEQVSISAISGLGHSKTITFKGKGNSTIIQYTPTSTNQTVISVNGVSNLIFDSFKVKALGNYGIGFNLYGQADSISIRNCAIELPSNNATYANTGIANFAANDGTGSSNTKKLNITNNRIEGGYIGVRLYGDLSVVNDFNIENNVIEDFGFLGMVLNSTKTILVKGNEIKSSIAGARSAITMWPTGTNVSVLGNTVSLGSVVNHTRVIQVAGAPGSGGSSWTEQVLVANNLVRYHGTQTSNVTGVYIKHVNYLKIYNNTVHMASGGGVKSLWLDALSATGNIDVKNNILSNAISGGELLRVHNLITSTLDYNDHYNANGFRVVWKGTAHTTLAAYQSATNQDSNGVSINPSFVSGTNLRVDSSNASLDDRGTYVSEVTKDIDGIIRSTTKPDMGANEFNARSDIEIAALASPEQCVKLSFSVPISVWIKNKGPYTISNIPLTLLFNGNAAVNETHTGAIGSGDSALHTFVGNKDFSTAGLYNIKVYSNLRADQKLSNDTGTYSIAATSVHLFTRLKDSIGICKGDSLSIDAKGLSSSSYLWSDNSTDKMLKLSPASIGLGTTPYWVKVTDNNGCILYDTVQVMASNPPSVQLGNDTSLCADQNIILGNSLSNGQYVWQDNSTNKTLDVDMAGTYHVSVSTGFGCMVSDTIEVSYFNPINLNFKPLEEICRGDSLTLDAGTNYASYLWSDLSTQSSLKVADAGTYYVKVEDNNGCQASDTTTVLVNEIPNFTLGKDTMFCEGGSIVLDATLNGHNYLWINNVTGPRYTVRDSGSYWVRLTNAKNCSASDTIHIMEGALPEVHLGADTTICEGTTLTLDATNDGASYLWQDNSDKPNYLVQDSGTYWVQVTGMNGCINTDDIDVTTNPRPTINLGRDTAIGSVVLKNHPLRIQAELGYTSYLWSNGSTQSYIDIDETVAIGEHEYSVIVTNGFDCESYDTIKVEVYDNTSTYSLGAPRFKVYPNPSSTQFIISFDEVGEEMTFGLYDLIGRNIMNKSVQKGSATVTIDASLLPKGTYLLKLNGVQGYEAIRLVVN